MENKKNTASDTKSYNAQQCEIGRKYGFISLYTV